VCVAFVAVAGRRLVDIHMKCVCVAFVAVAGRRYTYTVCTYLLTATGTQGRTDKNLCRCFGAPARRVFPDHLITYSNQAPLGGQPADEARRSREAAGSVGQPGQPCRP
jgi:hypothetical protein